MVQPCSQQFTGLLRRWAGGDKSALPPIVDLAYPELRRIARRCLSREPAEHTIQATALVHEAYLRLAGIQQISWQDRAHFFAIVAKLMRQALTDHARAHQCLKRGGNAQRGRAMWAESHAPCAATL